MEQFEIQTRLDIEKWLDSENNHADLCGTYPYCAYCENDPMCPCASAYLREAEANLLRLASHTPSHSDAVAVQVIENDESDGDAREKTAAIVAETIEIAEAVEEAEPVEAAKTSEETELAEIAELIAAAEPITESARDAESAEEEAEEPTAEIFSADEDAEKEAAAESADSKGERGPSLTFTQKLEAAPDNIKTAYNEIVNEFNKDKRTHNRITKSCDTITIKRAKVGKIVMLTKGFKLFLALNPTDPDFESIPHKDAGTKKAYADIPFEFRVSSALSVRRAKDLVAAMLAKYELQTTNDTADDQ